MGLITPIELPTVDELGAVHFIAIGGSGMNGIASVMLRRIGSPMQVACGSGVVGNDVKT